MLTKRIGVEGVYDHILWHNESTAQATSSDRTMTLVTEVRMRFPSKRDVLNAVLVRIEQEVE